MMEYMPLGNLKSLGNMSSEEVRIVVYQALQALVYLHDDKNITHRDIKPENILVRSRTPELFIKLCDFGLSSESYDLKTACGTKLYAAPEIYSKSYSKSVDIWAMGVLGYQYMIGLPSRSGDVGPKKWAGDIRRAIDLTISWSNDPAFLLLSKMLELNSQDRPSARECLSYPWMQNAPETISVQSTEILDPPLQRGAMMPDPIVQGESRKHLQSSESVISRAQSSYKRAKRLQIDKNLESNVKGLSAKGTDKHVGKDRGTTEAGRDTVTPHIWYDENTTLQAQVQKT